MSEHTRVLGVDFGTVRVGLAVSDARRVIASPLMTYHRKGKVPDAEFFLRLMEQEAIGHIVIGLPVHFDGSEGGKAAEARAYGAWLTQLTSLPVTYFDERFTTVHAEQELQAAGLTSKRRKARRDRVAAQMVLQGYLDSGCPADPPSRALDA